MTWKVRSPCVASASMAFSKCERAPGRSPRTVLRPPRPDRGERVASGRSSGWRSATLLYQGGLGAKIALHAGQEAARKERLGPVSGKCAGLTGEEALEPAPPLAEQPPGIPVVVERGCDANSGFGTIGRRKFKRLSQIRLLQRESVDPRELSGTDPVTFSFDHQLLVPISVSAGEFGILTGLVRLFAAVVADGIEHPEPYRPARLHVDQIDLSTNDATGSSSASGVRVGAADLFHRGKFEAAGEHGEAGPQLLLLRRAQLVAPVDAEPEGLLPRRGVASAAGQSVKRSVSRCRICSGDIARIAPPPVRSAGATRRAGGRSRPRRPCSPR